MNSMMVWVVSMAGKLGAAKVLAWLPPAGIFIWLWQYLRRPKLDLTVGPREPWSIQTPAARPPGADAVAWASDGLLNYYRIRVHNNGKNTARGCHVTLTNFWYVERGVWQRLVGWEPVDLIWSGRAGERGLAISPQQTEFCDIGHVASNFIQSNLVRPTAMRRIRRYLRDVDRQARFMLDLAREYNAQPNALEQGHYVLELAVYSENSSTSKVVIDLWVSGRFADLLDTYSPGSLGGVVLAARRKSPEERTLDEDADPAAED